MIKKLIHKYVKHFSAESGNARLPLHLLEHRVLQQGEFLAFHVYDLDVQGQLRADVALEFGYDARVAQGLRLKPLAKGIGRIGEDEEQ